MVVKLFIIIGTIFTWIFFLWRKGIHIPELEIFLFFLLCIVALYPDTIEKRILKAKRKKFVKDMTFKDGIYVFNDEPSEINPLVQKLNHSQRKRKVMFNIIIISLFSLMVILLIWLFFRLRGQNLSAPVFFRDYMNIFSSIMTLILITAVGILQMESISGILYKNKDVKTKVNEINVISEIVKKVNPRYIYTYQESPKKYKELAEDKYAPYIEINTLYKSAGWDKYYNEIYVDNCIFGKTNKNQIFKFANILTVLRGNKRTTKDFEGIFLCVEKNNTIYSGIKIKRKGVNNVFWNKFLEKSDEKLYYEFNELLKYYTISAKNVDFVNNHISDRLVDYLLQVKNEFPFEFEIIFDDENTYLRVFTGELFTPESIKDDNLKYYYSIIKYTTEMINNLSNFIK